MSNQNSRFVEDDYEPIVMEDDEAYDIPEKGRGLSHGQKKEQRQKFAMLHFCRNGLADFLGIKDGGAEHEPNG